MSFSPDELLLLGVDDVETEEVVVLFPFALPVENWYEVVAEVWAEVIPVMLDVPLLLATVVCIEVVELSWVVEEAVVET